VGTREVDERRTLNWTYKEETKDNRKQARRTKRKTENGKEKKGKAWLEARSKHILFEEASSVKH